MFGNALDNMLSQYHAPANTPVSSPAPTAPGRFFDNSSSPASPVGGSPNSFFNAVNAGGISTGASPFGALIPDLSKATPEQLKYITDTLSHLTYDVAAGGYIDNSKNYGNTVFGPRGYYNRAVALPDEPQLDASNVYNLIGGLPTKPIGTPALNALPGYNPIPRPSLNDTSGHPYSGPFNFPNWRNNG